MERVSEAGRILVDRKAELKASIRRETEELGRIEAALSALGVNWSGDINSQSDEESDGESGPEEPSADERAGAQASVVGVTEVGRLVQRAYRRQVAKKRKR